MRRRNSLAGLSFQQSRVPKGACYVQAGATENWMVLNPLFHTDYISKEGKIINFLKYYEVLDKIIEAKAKLIKKRNQTRSSKMMPVF